MERKQGINTIRVTCSIPTETSCFSECLHTGCVLAAQMKSSNKLYKHVEEDVCSAGGLLHVHQHGCRILFLIRRLLVFYSFLLASRLKLSSVVNCCCRNTSQKTGDKTGDYLGDEGRFQLLLCCYLLAEIRRFSSLTIWFMSWNLSYRKSTNCKNTWERTFAL